MRGKDKYFRIGAGGVDKNTCHLQYIAHNLITTSSRINSRINTNIHSIYVFTKKNFFHSCTCHKFQCHECRVLIYLSIKELMSSNKQTTLSTITTTFSRSSTCSTRKAVTAASLAELVVEAATVEAVVLVGLVVRIDNRVIVLETL